MFLRRGRRLNYSTASGNRKELRYSNMMDRDGKMGEKNVRQRLTGGKETCWSHLFRMRTVPARDIALLLSIGQTVKRRTLECPIMKFW